MTTVTTRVPNPKHTTGLCRDNCPGLHSHSLHPGLDKDKINKIIAAASKGSRFYKHAQEKEKQLQMRIDKMLEERAKLTAEVRVHHFPPGLSFLSLSITVFTLRI